MLTGPKGLATVDLGARELVVVPVPGHQDEGITLYDSKTGWLLTGDNLYPGRLYVNDWAAFRSSARRLAEFSKTHRISAVMGAHIEMSSTGKLTFDAPSFITSYARETLDMRRFVRRLSPIAAKAACCADRETHVPSPLSFPESTRK